MSVDAIQAGWILEIEEGIRSLRDIDGVSVQASGDEVREVHILTTSNRPAKQIVRDVQTLMLTRFRRSIDHRIVSVAYAESRQSPTAHEAAPAAPVAPAEPAPTRTVTAHEPVASTAARRKESAHEDRIRFEGANVFVSGSRVQAQVELRFRGVPRMGSASGWSTRDGAHRLIAAATLAAVQEFLDEQLALSLDALEFTRLGRRRAVVVGIELLAHRHARELVGVCTVGRDAQQAVVLATLQALNRVMGGLRLRESVDMKVRPASSKEE